MPTTRMASAALCLFLTASYAGAQEPTPTPATPIDAFEPPPSPEARPGRFRLGPVYLTPRLRLGNVGLDTNVFYTATDRRTDVSGSAGPGLDVVLPVRKHFRFLVSSGLEYVYFVRTASQRRLVGDAAGTATLEGARTRIELRSEYARSYRRPSGDIDRRIEQTTERVEGRLRRRLFGPTYLELEGEAATHDAEDVEYLGTRLQQTLTRRERVATAALQYDLTVKTGLRLESEVRRSRFPLAPARNADWALAAAGLRTQSATLLSGHAMAGVRWIRQGGEVFPGRRTLYVSTDLVWRGWAHTHVGGGYSRDRTYSPFLSEGLPTQQNETVTVVLGREIVRRVQLNLSGTRIRLVGDAPIRVEVAPGEIIEDVRDDEIYQASAELTFRLRPNLSAGATLRYSERRTNFRDLDVDGLLLGSTIVFTP